MSNYLNLLELKILFYYTTAMFTQKHMKTRARNNISNTNKHFCIN